MEKLFGAYQKALFTETGKEYFEVLEIINPYTGKHQFIGRKMLATIGGFYEATEEDNKRWYNSEFKSLKKYKTASAAWKALIDKNCIE